MLVAGQVGRSMLNVPARAARRRSLGVAFVEQSHVSQC